MGLHLRVDGRSVWPVRTGDVFEFHLQANARNIHLCSYDAASADFDPHSADRRRLGVAVMELDIDGVAIGADHTSLGTGWYPAESLWQWTDGSAELNCAGARHIRVTLANTGLMHWRHRDEGLDTRIPIRIEV